MTTEIRPVRSAEETADAATVIRGLVATVKARLPALSEQVDAYYRGSWFMDAEPAVPPQFRPPLGEVLLAYRGGAAVGSISFYPLEDGICEVKSLFVSEVSRGQGIAKALCAALLSAARDQGYELVRLSTTEFQPEAVSLYRAMGFREVDPWEEPPEQIKIHYMERPLGDATP